jgi:hypothetical protein
MPESVWMVSCSAEYDQLQDDDCAWNDQPVLALYNAHQVSTSTIHLTKRYDGKVTSTGMTESAISGLRNVRLRRQKVTGIELNCPLLEYSDTLKLVRFLDLIPLATARRRQPTCSRIPASVDWSKTRNR